MKKGRQFLINTLLLTLTSFLMRGVGVTFQVYLSRRIGSTGIGLFQLVSSVYLLFITFATSGIRLAATRLVAEEYGLGNPAGARRAIRCCLCYSLMFGTTAALLLHRLAPFIATELLGDARTLLSLRVLAFSLPFLAMTSVLGGYFTAVRRVVKSAATQVFEQFLIIFLTVMGLSYFLPQDLELACAVIVGGSTLGEMLSFLLLGGLYLGEKRQEKRRAAGAGAKATHLGGIPRRMFSIALPVAVSAYARSGLSTVEHLLIPRELRRSGISADTALTAYGTIHGMVMPVLLFPSALLYTVADLLVPELAECRAQNNLRRQNHIIDRVFQGTFLFSIGVTGILYFFAEPLGMAIYQNPNVSYFIRILTPLVPAMYLDAAVDGMLKGVGEQMASMRYNILDSLTGILLTLTLLPRFAINGYIITIFITELLNFYLSARRLIGVTGYELSLGKLLLRPLFCIGAALLFGTLLPTLLPGGGLVVQVVLVTGFYLLCLVLAGSITGEDLRWMRGLLG